MTATLHKNQLAGYFAQGCKPAPAWRIGMEHEKFLFHQESLARFGYEGEKGIRAVLEALNAGEPGAQLVMEKDRPVAVKMPRRRVSVTLEPGGQLELSGAPLATLHDTRAELSSHLGQVGKIVRAMGGLVVPVGTDPLWPRDQMPWMPKGRYQVMRNHMPAKGSLGLDMMTRTCTVQVNLDFADEADMVAKFRASMALQPLATALFASSPFLDGKLNGFQSYRAHIWQDTDPDRCGILPFVFEEGMGFERYADYLLDVPMYFLYRHGNYIDAHGQPFRAFMEGRLPALASQHPTLEDWADQATVAFPEVRLKQFLEMRGADSGPVDMLMALPAFWVGLLYDPLALDEAQQLVREWSPEDIQALHAHVPRQGLDCKVQNRQLKSVAEDAVSISRRGLQRRANMLNGRDESLYLAPLEEIACTGRTVASQMIEMFRSTGSVEKVIRHYALSAEN